MRKFVGRQLDLFDVGGALRPEVGMHVFASMAFPRCPRSVTAFEQMLRAEIEAQSREEDYQPGSLLEETIGKINFPLLSMVARMAHRVVKDHVDGKAVSKSKAAHMVSERHSTARLPSGKSVPSSPDRIRKAFDQYLPSLHLWAAVETARPLGDGRKVWGDEVISAMMVDQTVLVDVLVLAAQVREHLSAALGDFEAWEVPDGIFRHVDLDRFRPVKAWDDPASIEALLSYKARSGQ